MLGPARLGKDLLDRRNLKRRVKIDIKVPWRRLKGH